jgi:hypothetical protein
MEVGVAVGKKIQYLCFARIECMLQNNGEANGTKPKDGGLGVGPPGCRRSGDRPIPKLDQDLMKASRSALISSACVIGIPWG